MVLIKTVMIGKVLIGMDMILEILIEKAMIRRDMML